MRARLAPLRAARRAADVARAEWLASRGRPGDAARCAGLVLAGPDYDRSAAAAGALSCAQAALRAHGAPLGEARAPPSPADVLAGDVLMVGALRLAARHSVELLDVTAELVTEAGRDADGAARRAWARALRLQVCEGSAVDDAYIQCVADGRRPPHRLVTAQRTGLPPGALLRLWDIHAGGWPTRA